MKEQDYAFQWSNIGNIDLGRPNLGTLTSVAAYRMLQYSLRSVLNKKLGADQAAKIYFDAGKIAGHEFCKNVLNKKLEMFEFLAQFQDVLKELRVGLIRFEEMNPENATFTLAVAEDLDCSGLPVTNETVCDFDEGFISGILTEYFGKEIIAKETDCWSNGAKVCRFSIYPQP
jgi:hypothetical protein